MDKAKETSVPISVTPKNMDPTCEIFKFCQEAVGGNLPGVCDSNGPTTEEISLRLDAPLQLAWTVSRKCNFSCPHCFNNSGPNYVGYEPPREAIIENVCDAAPFNVCLCGGEPFVWEDFGSITRKLRDGGLPLVSAVTNGYLVTGDRLTKAVDEGLNSLQFSIDGAFPEEHRRYRPTRDDSWERAMQAVSNAVNINGLHSIAVSWLPNRYNVESFPNFVRSLVDIGVTKIRVQPLMSCGRATVSYDLLRPTAEQYVQLQLMILQLNREFATCDKNHVFIEWGDPLEHIWLYTQTPAIPQHLGIQSNGWYELSPYIPVLFGDASKHCIREFWSKSVKEMWMIPLILEMADILQILDGMREITPRIYFEDPVLIDWFDEENWALAQETSDPEILIDHARSKGLYEWKECVECHQD